MIRSKFYKELNALIGELWANQLPSKITKNSRIELIVVVRFPSLHLEKHLKFHWAKDVEYIEFEYQVRLQGSELSFFLKEQFHLVFDLYLLCTSTHRAKEYPSP